MIGFYNYTVILTYMSLASSTIGIITLLNGHPILAVLCLAISGFFDMFDGKVARMKKDRTEDEKMYGIQIDSLCDMVCFGFYPAIICYVSGAKSYVAMGVMIFYAIAAVIRLAFFNVLEINRQMKEDGENKFYHGLPVTSIAAILPIIFLLKFIILENVFNWILTTTLLVTGIAFITDFKFKKPTNKTLTGLVTIIGIVLLIILKDYYLK